MKPNKNFANEINADRTKSRELEETPPLKNGFEFLSQSQKRNLRIKDGFAFALWRCQPTVCVTCAGAGTAKPSNQKNDKA